MFLKGWFFQVSIFIHNYTSFICFHFHFPYENESLSILESNHHHDSVVDDLSNCLVRSKMAMNYEW